MDECYLPRFPREARWHRASYWPLGFQKISGNIQLRHATVLPHLHTYRVSTQSTRPRAQVSCLMDSQLIKAESTLLGVTATWTWLIVKCSRVIKVVWETSHRATSTHRRCQGSLDT